MSEYTKPYRPGTPRNHIIEDGWSRGFSIMQTWNELHNMGYNTDIEEVNRIWEALDKSYDFHCKGNITQAQAWRMEAFDPW